MATISIQEAQARLPALIAELKPGEQVLITQDHHTIARLVAEPARSAKKPLGIEDIRRQREAILKLGAKYGVGQIRVFGSITRGAAGPASDIDFLVKMDEKRSLLDLAGFWQGLTELLDRPVDIVTERGLHPALAARILAEAVPL
jgi:predicted nucleotidyltransferase